MASTSFDMPDFRSAVSATAHRHAAAEATARDIPAPRRAARGRSPARDVDAIAAAGDLYRTPGSGLILVRIASAFLLWVAAAAAFAATPIDQTRPLDPRGRVEIDNLKGRVEVRAWDRPEVRISGSLGDGVQRLAVDGDERVLRIRVVYPSRPNAAQPTRLQVMVPLLADLDVGTVSADIDVGGVAPRELALKSVSGDVTANGAPGRGRVSTVSGDIRLAINSRNLRVETVSGDVTAQGRLTGEVSVETVSGDTRLDTLGEGVRRLSANTVSGDLTLQAALADEGEVRIESVSGDVALTLPASLSATVSAESFSGRLQAPDATISKEQFGPGSSFRVRYGQGKGDVRLQTFSGDATLRLK